MTTVKVKPNYKDITKKWMKTLGTEKGTCVNQGYYINDQNERYDRKNAVLIFDHTSSEKRIANWFAQTKKLNIRMLPRVVSPQNIKIGDFIEVTSKKIWEIKEPKGNTIGTTMINQFKGQRKKANKFIIDIYHSKMDNDIAISEIESILSNIRYEWVEEVVLLNNLNILKVFSR